jgi:hypothetical protein
VVPAKIPSVFVGHFETTTRQFQIRPTYWLTDFDPQNHLSRPKLMSCASKQAVAFIGERKAEQQQHY